MLTLKTLGLLDIRGADGVVVHSVLRQPKRFALLVYLTMRETSGYVRRDTLLPLLWPESDEVSARHALAQALYTLRCALGSEVLEAHGHDMLRLRPGTIRCDAPALRDAIAAGRHDEARDL